MSSKRSNALIVSAQLLFDFTKAMMKMLCECHPRDADDLIFKFFMRYHNIVNGSDPTIIFDYSFVEKTILEKFLLDFGRFFICAKIRLFRNARKSEDENQVDFVKTIYDSSFTFFDRFVIQNKEPKTSYSGGKYKSGRIEIDFDEGFDIFKKKYDFKKLSEKVRGLLIEFMPKFQEETENSISSYQTEILDVKEIEVSKRTSRDVDKSGSLSVGSLSVGSLRVGSLSVGSWSVGSSRVGSSRVSDMEGSYDDGWGHDD